MPELPEVETTCRGIAPHIIGATIEKLVVRNGSLRWPVDKNLAKYLKNKNILSVSRRAKYILLGFENGQLAIHLGMSGNLRIVSPEETVKKHDHIDVVMGKGGVLRFHDPRRFGAFVWVEGELSSHKLFKDLGPEPLEDAFDLDYLFACSRKKKVSVKSFIMNAHVVVGVGNIYANEALFMSGIHPERFAGSISRKRYLRLIENIKKVLSMAVERGGTTLKDFTNAEGKPGYFSQQLLVYGRKGEPCVECGCTLQELRISQRSTIFCKKCQK